MRGLDLKLRAEQKVVLQHLLGRTARPKHDRSRCPWWAHRKITKAKDKEQATPRGLVALAATNHRSVAITPFPSISLDNQSTSTSVGMGLNLLLPNPTWECFPGARLSSKLFAKEP
jgi:hypothetical protein